MANPQTFIVDIGKTMVDTSRLASDGKDRQKLFCRCGHSQTFNHKIKRNIVKNQDTTVEDKQSLDTIKCDKCKTLFDGANKVNLLVPDKEGIFSVSYENFNWINASGEKISTLKKVKYFAKYSSSSDKLVLLSKTDTIRFNHSTKKFSIFLVQPGADDDSQISGGSSESKNYENVSEMLSLNRLTRLEHFFRYFEFVTYVNLEEAFLFFQSIEGFVIDLQEIKKIPSISHIYKCHEVIEETGKSGSPELYQMQDSGYGDGRMVKKKLSVGSYLANLQDLSKSFVAVTSFPSIATILLTKGREFFFELLHSSNICNPNVYYMNGATYPTKIAEVSTNFDRSGVLKKLKETKSSDEDTKRKREIKKEVADGGEDRNYIKISPVIFKHIKSPTDMDILLNVYHKGYVTKQDIESILQAYDPDRTYRLFRQLDKHSRNDIEIVPKHIHHILKDKLDEHKTGHSDFLSIYTDTLRSIGLLELGEKYIFKIKSYKELKDSHDDLAARYNAIRDAKKSEFYVKSVNEFNHLNCVIGDVKFEVVPTLENLNKEGMTMGHCIYTYLNRICEKGYLAVHVQHIISNERSTLGLVRNVRNVLEFEQLKGYQNSRASAEMIECVIKFCKSHDIPTSKGHSSDLSPNTGYTKRMHDYLSDKDVEKIRADRKKKQDAEKKKKEADGGDKKKGFLGIF
jgi:hypothetical protein